MSEQLWREYRASREPALRQQLIEAHLPLVRYIATKMLPGLHASVEHQDLVSWGVFGLMDAVERYDPDAGTKFSTFATYRIQGSINDEMRAQAWEPRSVRARFRAVSSATSELEHELGRTPTELEVATRVGITIEELGAIQRDIDHARVASLSAERSGGEDDERGGIGDLLAAADLGHLEHEMAELSASVATAVTRLPEQDQLLFAWVYAERMPFKQIAQTLGVTESWVSHLHTRGMVRLQRILSARY